MFPLREAAASYALNGSLNIVNQGKFSTFKKNAKQDYKVKNRQQATQMVKEKYRAKVLSIQSTKVNGNNGYKAKLLGNDGIVFYVYIDATSGQMKRR